MAGTPSWDTSGRPEASLDGSVFFIYRRVATTCVARSRPRLAVRSTPHFPNPDSVAPFYRLGDDVLADNHLFGLALFASGGDVLTVDQGRVVHAPLSSR